MRCTSCGEPVAVGQECPCGGRAEVEPRVQVLRFRVAGFWRRLLATVVDLLLLAPLVAGVAAASARIAGAPLPRSLGVDLLVGLLLEGNPAALFTAAVAGVLAFVYLMVFLSARGQTPGKRLLGVRVINMYGEPPGAARTLLRLLGYATSWAVLGLGFVWIGFDREKRGLHDWIAGTWAVRSRPRATRVEPARARG